MSAHKLRDKALKLLRDRPASIKLNDIAEGTGLSLSWVKKFAATGERFSPSADKLVMLHDHLAKNKLKI